MPKVRPLTSKDALAREWKNDDERIRRNIGMRAQKGRAAV